MPAYLAGSIGHICIHCRGTNVQMLVVIWIWDGEKKLFSLADSLRISSSTLGSFWLSSWSSINFSGPEHYNLLIPDTTQYCGNLRRRILHSVLFDLPCESCQLYTTVFSGGPSRLPGNPNKLPLPPK
jgi:hypothetical protein